MKDIKGWCVTVAALICICMYPCLFQYTANIPESRFRDALLFFGIFMACSVLVLGFSLLIFRKIWRAGFVSCLLMLVVTNFGLLNSAVQNALPWFHGYYVLGILLVIIALLAVLAVRKNLKCIIPTAYFLLMFGVLNLTSLGVAVPKLVKLSQNQHAEVPEAEESVALEQTPSETAAHPNVYYYIYDEYAGPQCLEHYYGYDNSAFYQELEQRGFTCSSDSINPEGIATVDNVPDLYNLDYAAPSYFDSTDGKMPALYQLFRSMGYQINLISHNDFLDTDGARLLSMNQAEDSICTYLYQNSLLGYTPLSSRIETLPQLRSSYAYESLLQNALGLMQNAWKYTEAEQPTLTLGYVQCPHTKFIYDCDGNIVDETYAWDWDDPQYYLGQLEYTNQQILKEVDAIQKHDPDAVIILQSDHGARKAEHALNQNGTEYDHAVEMPYMENILNCVYAGGTELDFAGKSGVNTLRYLMNTLYGTHYDMLPDPPTE